MKWVGYGLIYVALLALSPFALLYKGLEMLLPKDGQEDDDRPDYDDEY